MGKDGGTSLTGAAGEHLVMSRLLSRGYIAALAPQGVPNLDIVVTSVDGSHLCAFQVKTRWDKGGYGGWRMRAKHEDIANDKIFYCFVDLGKHAEATPCVHVLPSKVVASLVKSSHRIWLEIPGKNGKPHKDTSMRVLLPDYSKLLGVNATHKSGWLDGYRENWDQIKAVALPAPELID